MKRLIAIISAMFSCSALYAEEALQTVSWLELFAAGRKLPGVVIPRDAQVDFDYLKIEKAGGPSQEIPLASLSNPGIATDFYVVSGMIRYQGVDPAGYLQMWNHFPDGRQFFSRALADQPGPLQHILGNSGWRPFALPFFINGATELDPSALEISLILPGKGEVDMGPMTLYQYATAAELQQKLQSLQMQFPAAVHTSPEPRAADSATRSDANAPPSQSPGDVAHELWDERTADLVFRILGGVVGLIGGVVGLLAGLGRARRVVMGLLMTMTTFGGACLILGLIALLAAQPSHIYYPLLCVGIFCPAVGFWTMRVIRNRYAAIEFRKMSALDQPAS